VSESESEALGPVFGLFRASVLGVQAQIEPAAADLELVAGALAGHREHHRDGAGRVYGPFDDPAGRGDAAWVVVAHEDGLSVQLSPEAEAEAQTVMDGHREGASFRWTLWAGHHAAGIGTEGPAAGAGARDVVIESGDTGRAMTIGSLVDVPNDAEDPLGPVFDDGVAFWTDADGGWVQLRSVAPLPAGIVGFTPASNPWFAVAWGESVGPVVAQIEGPSGMVEIHECVDAAGHVVYRSIEPASAGVPGQMFGALSDCRETRTVTPMLPGG